MSGKGKSWKSIQAKYMTEIAQRIAALNARIEDDVKGNVSGGLKTV